MCRTNHVENFIVNVFFILAYLSFKIVNAHFLRCRPPDDAPLLLPMLFIDIGTAHPLFVLIATLRIFSASHLLLHPLRTSVAQAVVSGDCLKHV